MHALSGGDVDLDRYHKLLQEAIAEREALPSLPTFFERISDAENYN